ncbi:putative peptidyl-prolyl cis-trans isomerase dodo [Epargyreus clarus]|uniref:putative peptidyl-prolyl cis-trans isomerase dodo n=1 Tax=Epargyreus clarus TaxID=520877 RepID=UPI003C305AAB
MSDEEEHKLPDGWERRKSRSTGMPYFLNRMTRESQWDMPGAPSTSAPGPSSSSEHRKAEAAALPREVHCRHILVKHEGSRRPCSWREDKVTRSKEEACALARDYRRSIIDKEKTFEELARIYSDCSSAMRDGDLGRFRRGQMQRPFEEAAFVLRVGQLSHPVESDSGIHIILRIA